MHELSLANSIIHIINTQIPFDIRNRISIIKLEVGKLSGIETDALIFAFEMLKETTEYSKANLQINFVEGEAQCEKCFNQFFYTFGDACSKCGSYQLKIVKGKEMKVIGVEIN